MLESTGREALRVLRDLSNTVLRARLKQPLFLTLKAIERRRVGHKSEGLKELLQKERKQYVFYVQKQTRQKQRLITVREIWVDFGKAVNVLTPWKQTQNTE